MVDLVEAKRLLVVGLNAGLAATGQPFEIFEEGHEVHKFMIEEEFEGAADAVVLAEDNRSEYGVLIVPVIRPVESDTIFGKRTDDRVTFDVYTPEYDDGDWSVGIQGGWILDPNDLDAETFERPYDAAKKAVMWLIEQSVSIRMDNEFEADYYRHEPEEPVW